MRLDHVQLAYVTALVQHEHNLALLAQGNPRSTSARRATARERAQFVGLVLALLQDDVADED